MSLLKICYKYFVIKKNILYLCSLNRNIMRIFVLAISLLISTITFAQVPSVKVENAKGESFDTVSLLDEGSVSIIPTDTTLNPNTQSYDITSVRTGKVVEWYPKHVRVRAYNENNGKKEEQEYLLLNIVNSELLLL